MFARVLVANRGEIALRVLRTLHALGVEGVAVYSDADADAPHVRAADRAVRLGPAPAAESYLAIERVVAAALETGCEAVHPGYGFLSERPEFARACTDAGLTFVGPSAEAMALLGDKAAAKQVAADAGVPVVPGLHGDSLGDAEIVDWARSQELPLLVKAVAGGGGKGMRMVRTAGRAARGAQGGAQRGARVLRRRPPARRTLDRAPAPHRGAGARRSARLGAAPGRARVQPAAPPPEGDRGGALAGRRRRAARAPRRRGGRARPQLRATRTPARSSSSRRPMTRRSSSSSR